MGGAPPEFQELHLPGNLPLWQSFANAGRIGVPAFVQSSQMVQCRAAPCAPCSAVHGRVVHNTW
eukprot:gene20719-biopygen1059